jgi:hypothetical protein
MYPTDYLRCEIPRKYHGSTNGKAGSVDEFSERIKAGEIVKREAQRYYGITVRSLCR